MQIRLPKVTTTRKTKKFKQWCTLSLKHIVYNRKDCGWACSGPRNYNLHSLKYERFAEHYFARVNLSEALVVITCVDSEKFRFVWLFVLRWATARTLSKHVLVWNWRNTIHSNECRRRSHTVTASLHDKGQFIPFGFNPIVQPVSNHIFSDNMYLNHHYKDFAQLGPASLIWEMNGRFTPFVTRPGDAGWNM